MIKDPINSANALRSTLVATLLFVLSGCGLGTEVGNGARPNDDEDKQQNKAAASSEDSQDDNDVNTSKVSPTSEDGNGGGDSEGGEIPEANGAASDQVSSFDLQMMFNACASPFEETYDKAFELHLTGSSKAISGTYDSTDEAWTITDEKSSTLAVITDDGNPADFGVNVKDKDGNTITLPYTCSAVNGAAAGDFYTYKATLTKNDTKSILSWTVDTSGSARKLVKIDMQPDESVSTHYTYEIVEYD